MQSSEYTERMLAEAFGKIDRVALGLACGLCLGLALFVVTIALVVKGGETVGPHLTLLSQFYIGYEVSILGSLIGFAYAFVTGFAAGWVIGFVHYVVTATYLFLIRFWVNLTQATDYIDPDHSAR